ncbi:MAG: FtsX-like permease family protein [Spirochaetales bacterium]
MSPGLGLKLGWTAFRSRGRGEARFLWSSSLALALGLVPLVLVLAIADGMIEGISSRTIETSLSHDQAWPLVSTPKVDPETALKVVPGFRSALREQQGFALAFSAGARLGVSLRGVEARWALDPGVRRFLKADSGSLTFPNARSAWVGRESAVKLRLKVGDTVKLLTTRSVGTLSAPRVTSLTVAAIVSVGYEELDRLWVFVPVETSLTLLDSAENPVFWGLKSDRPLAESAAFLHEVRSALGSDWQVYSWQSTGRSQFLNYQATRFLLLVVMALILLVSAVNISTSMVTLVQQRRQETAILKALGGSTGLIRSQFLVLGLGAGTVGTAVGMAAGVAVALGINGLISGLETVLNGLSALRAWISGQPFTATRLLDPAYYLESLPVKFDVPLLVLVAFGTIALAALASAVPAWRASRQRPLDVLRRA